MLWVLLIRGRFWRCLLLVLRESVRDMVVKLLCVLRLVYLVFMGFKYVTSTPSLSTSTQPLTDVRSDTKQQDSNQVEMILKPTRCQHLTKHKAFPPPPPPEGGKPF
ncbi:MAG: hypothetical protein J3R72DRAFT_75231 [Linnemannia gamsii]|nr:MAG: hypothetical protein J3R72DRAFT_75231 [Linnemannia gamsii]